MSKVYSLNRYRKMGRVPPIGAKLMANAPASKYIPHGRPKAVRVLKINSEQLDKLIKAGYTVAIV